MTDERKPTPDEVLGMAWWMQAAGNTGVAADAWAAFKEGRATA